MLKWRANEWTALIVQIKFKQIIMQRKVTEDIREETRGINQTRQFVAP